MEQEEEMQQPAPVTTRQIYLDPRYHLMSPKEIADTYGFGEQYVIKAIAKLRQEWLPARMRITVRQVTPNVANNAFYLTEHTVLQKLLPYLRGEVKLPDKAP